MENTSTLLILNPDDENKEYRCDVCYKYLSISPILFSDRIGSVCGRCYNDEDLDLLSTETIFHIQKAYENIANYIIFPCIYHNNGCNKQLRWCEVRDHEEMCDYKNIICPLSYPTFNAQYECDPTDICEWKGINKDLIQHIRNSHSNCVSNSNELAILSLDEDMRNDECNKILFFEVDGIFAIAVLYYFKNFECYYCNVLIDSSFKDCELFYYDLEILDITNKRCLILPGNKVDSLLGRNLTIKKKIGLELDIEMIKQFLKKSDIMTLSFKVMKVFKDKTEYLIKEASHESDKETLIPDVNCPCGGYLFFPVNICKNGHNCCEVCKFTNGFCQKCKTGFMKKTNSTLGNITTLTKYSCKNKPKGCTYTFEYDDLFKHENNCNLTTKNCVLKCNWKGTNQEMVKHMREKHCILQLKKENTFDQQVQSKSYPILFDNKIFILTIEYKFECPLFISMQCLGLEKWDYEFEFRILSSSTSINLLSTHICQPLTFEFPDSCARPRQIEYPFSFLCQFLTEFDKLKFKVNISKIQH
ncbi:hypothetical protein WA026_016932 [Henosepilachna vigintioctopunctata]|uniref:SIAH-type domain-containing protein n=1 Tax=Henosepilachna vigintioctopunctata TaxID=420089 RepID=A0AAW1U7Z9_9CUCU